MEQQKPSFLSQAKALLTNKNLLVVMLLLTLNTCATEMSKTTINVYGQSLGAAVAVLGFIATLQSWGKVAMRPFSGRGIDKFDPRKWMIFCATLRALTYLSFALFDSVVMFGVSRALEGVTLALMATSMYSLTGLCVTKAQIGTAMALYTFIPALFQSGAITAASYVYEWGPKMPFFVSAALLGIMILCSFMLKIPPRSEAEKVESGQKVSEKAANTPKGKFKLSNFIAYEGLLFLPMMWANSALIATEDLLIVVYATSLGYPAAGALYFSVATLVRMWAVVPMGALADRFGAKWAIYFGFLVKATGFILLALFPSAVMFTVSGICRGLAQPMQNVMQAQAVKIMPRSKMGIANSTHLLLTDFGVMLMSIVAGLVCNSLGYSSAFMIFGCISTLGAVFYMIIRKKIEKMVEDAMIADAAAENT